MKLADPLVSELEYEAATTRRVLDRIPDSEFGWKPHPKSFSLGELASHTANIADWAAITLTTDELNLDPVDSKPWLASTRAELLEQFDRNLAKSLSLLREADDEHLRAPWTLKSMGQTVLTLPRSAVLRTWVLNHMIHHRGQLAVYLRLRDIPVPSIYGPSADEQPAR